MLSAYGARALPNCVAGYERVSQVDAGDVILPASASERNSLAWLRESVSASQPSKPMPAFTKFSSLPNRRKNPVQKLGSHASLV